jgi:hypothetical protein
MHEDEELAIEFLLGTPGPKGRTYLQPGSERELKARAVLARIMLTEAPDGYFTRLVAALIDPPRRSAIIKRKIVFQRARGTPVVVGDRRRVEIAAFMHDQLQKQKRGATAGNARARNLKRVVGAAQDKFGVSRATVMKVWSGFRPRKTNGSSSGPNK